MSKCKHGMILQTCAFCRIPPSVPVTPIEKKVVARKPSRRTEMTVHGAAALSSEALLGYAVVRPSFGRTHRSFMELDDSITFVHFDGTPLLWAIEMVLERAKNVKTIRVIPTALRKMHPESHLKLCKERGVEVITGHHAPHMAWADKEQRTPPHYDVQKSFLESLEGEQKALLEELLAMGFEEAEMVARYFCLQGEPYAPIRVLLIEFGYSPRVDHVMSQLTGAVLRYLDPSFQALQLSINKANYLRRRVGILRSILNSEAARVEAANKIGLANLPTKFPLARLDTLGALMKKRNGGDLDRLRNVQPNAYKALICRFGIEEGLPTQYRTLEEVGHMMNDITRERVRQLEERALELLGLAVEAN